QAEDGIRDLTVTGVQTCALPIYEQQVNALQEITEVAGELGVPRQGSVLVPGGNQFQRRHQPALTFHLKGEARFQGGHGDLNVRRSEERRVGKQCRSGWSWQS